MAKQTESAFLTLADAHYGKSTATFNPDICDRRFRVATERLARLRGLLSGSYEFDQLYIGMLGDINDGTDIYRTQSHHQAISNVERQAREVSWLLRRFLVEQADIWGKVTVYCVVGNHGRSRNAHEAASWDLVAYRYTSLIVQDDPRITFHVPNDYQLFLQVVNVRGHGILMHHGHYIKSYQGTPYYGIERRALQWAALPSVPDWRVMTMGHYHTCGAIDINPRQTVLLAGTMVTDDEWALGELGKESSNKWWLFGVANSRPLTWMLPVELMAED